ncbi:MAG: hypothetical protein JWM11_6374 [Planctomycetaceae bacterium]|nr:hypothetical protein [Planctomycetaceae bacterium]
MRRMKRWGRGIGIHPGGIKICSLNNTVSAQQNNHQRANFDFFKFPAFYPLVHHPTLWGLRPPSIPQVKVL